MHLSTGVVNEIASYSFTEYSHLYLSVFCSFYGIAFFIEKSLATNLAKPLGVASFKHADWLAPNT